MVDLATADPHKIVLAHGGELLIELCKITALLHNCSRKTTLLFPDEQK
jgi:hypothetical protein